LSPQGKRIIDEAIQLRLDAADESLRSLAASERKQLAALLRKLKREFEIE
jgi:DNA-binding MarR family transcriptional regulator